MTPTPNNSNGSIWAENPAIGDKCPTCGIGIKYTNDEQENPVLLSIPHQIRTIKIMEGRCFEKVDQRFVHVCSPPAASQQDSFRGVSVGQSALL